MPPLSIEASAAERDAAAREHKAMWPAIFAAGEAEAAAEAAAAAA